MRISGLSSDVCSSDLDDHAEPDVPPVSSEPPESAALRAEVRRLIESKIDQLPDVFRSVFVLRALEDMSADETADCLGVPAATVRTRYFRAKGLLRSEEHTSELQSLMRISYAVFCLKKK